MLLQAAKRYLSILPTAPWKWKQTLPSVVLKGISKGDAKIVGSLGIGKIEVGFSQLVEALGTHNYDRLSQLLEKNLYTTVETRLKEMESLGYRMHPIDLSGRKAKIHNFELHMGVNLTRSDNLPYDDYDQVFTANEIKASLNADYLNKLIKPETDSEKLNLEEEDLGKVWVYLCSKAPAKVVCAVCAEFRGGRVLTMRKEEKDVVYQEGDKADEVHVIRFECIAADLKGSQDIVSGGVLALMPTILNCDLDLQRADWLITDIDDVLGGNPIVQPNSS